jgi:hypothetical protein
MTTTMMKPGGDHLSDDEIAHAPSATEALSPMVDSPLPIFTGAQMAKALTAYRDLQTALDRSMPEQIMNLDGRPFRKKGYWRAIAVAFGLRVEPMAERREVSGTFEDGRENFGYIVDYRATAPNGRTVVSDGTCFAVEKARRFKCPHPERPGAKRTLHFPHHTCPDFDPNFHWRILPAEATEHNVRGHAHTRAFNRAVSNLVGFGEVSAEEVVRGEDPDDPGAPAPSAPIQPPQRKAEPVANGGAKISEQQGKRFFAIAMKAGWEKEALRAWLKQHYHVEHSRDILQKDYEAICKAVEHTGAATEREPGSDDF